MTSKNFQSMIDTVEGVSRIELASEFSDMKSKHSFTSGNCFMRQMTTKNIHYSFVQYKQII